MNIVQEDWKTGAKKAICVSILHAIFGVLKFELKKNLPG